MSDQPSVCDAERDALVAVRAFLDGEMTYKEFRRIEAQYQTARLERFHGAHPQARVGPPREHVATPDEATLLERIRRLEGALAIRTELVVVLLALNGLQAVLLWLRS